MAIVVFERTGVECEAREGASVRALCDAMPASGVPFGCRRARCGLCRVEVTEGAEHCAPPEVVESALLTRLGAQPRMRLACQLAVRAGEGRVRLRVTL